MKRGCAPGEVFGHGIGPARVHGGHPTGGADVDTAYGRQFSVPYAACFIVMHGVAALGEDGFEDFVKGVAADLAARG